MSKITRNELDGTLIDELNSFNEHQADLTSQEVGKGADIIGLPDPNNLFTSPTVGGAMQELFTNVSNGKSLVGRAIADVDPNIVIPTDPTFQELANAIGGISTGKKWASGLSRLDNGISGLKFKPSMLFYYLFENKTGSLAEACVFIEGARFGAGGHNCFSVKNTSPYARIYTSNAVSSFGSITNLACDAGTIYNWIALE